MDGGQDKQLNNPDQEEMLWEEEQLPNQQNEIQNSEEGERSDCSGSASMMDSDSDSHSSMEGILEENRKLKAAIGGLTEENKELKKTLKLTRKVLGPNWKTKMEEFQRKEKVRETLLLNDMLIEEERLEAVIVILNNSVNPLSRNVREKDAEVRKLTNRVTKLKERTERKSLNAVRADLKETEEAVWKGAVDVFPEEVWRMILGQVSDPKDLWNLTNTCQLFDDILHEWKIGFMLGQALPHLYRHLPTSVLMGFRAVSKGWNAVVDNFLEDHPSLRPHNEELADPRNLSFVCPLKEKRIATRNYFRFCNEEMFDLESSNMPVAPGQNPFVGRYVSLKLGPDLDAPVDEEEEGTEELWWNRLYQFLEAYGKEIWHLTVEFPVYPETPLMVRKIIEFFTVKVFQFLPNLRKLSMCDIMLFWGADENEDVHIDPLSIPEAPKLESIDHTPYYSETVVLEAYLHRFHIQLRHFTTNLNVWKRVRHLDWPNLTELHVDFLGGDLHLFYGRNMPLLTKLTVGLANLRCDLTYKKLSEVVTELASNTRLTTLRLLASFTCRGQDLPQAQALPNKLCYLKNLEVETRKPFNFDVVLRCFPLLENLNVFYTEDLLDIGLRNYLPEFALKPMDDDDFRKEMTSPKKQDELIDVNNYIYDGEIYKSNIWELLPLLKVFTFQWDGYTREGYEAYLRSRGGGASSSSV